MYYLGGVDFVVLVPMILQEFPDYYDKLVNCKPVRCLETNHTFETIRKPTAIVLDVRDFILTGPPMTHFELLVFPPSRFTAHPLCD
jgi:hypothetical protein